VASQEAFRGAGREGLGRPDAVTDHAPVTESALADAGLRLVIDGPVATVTLVRPEVRNAQTPAMWRSLAAAGRALPGDVRVVVLRGQGPSFSAGLDRRMFAPAGMTGEPSFADLVHSDDATLEAITSSWQEGFTWWRRNDIVSIAVVQGHAIGAGFQLALACDLRVVADDVQFSMKAPSLGLVPDLGGTKPLVELVGYARALEICATGRVVRAEEAERIGLANVVAPRSELQHAVQRLVDGVLAAPRDAIVETKALLRGAITRSYDDQCAAERAAQARRLRDLAGLGD
jgi:enoyl-CoA hydratase/carnithine racemase